MLKKIKITNFYSIGDEQELSLEISPKDCLDDSAREHKKGNYLNTVACIIGPNASGKTTFLKAFSFLNWFLEESYSSFKPEQAITFEPHKLHKNKPARIEIEFFEEKALYRYSIELDKKQVLKEQLDKQVRHFTSVFKLSRDGDKTEIKSKIKISDADEDRIKKRPNISLLSSLIVLGYLPEITFFKKIVTNVGNAGHYRPDSFTDSFKVSQVLFENEPFRKDVLSFSKEIDLGISDFAFREARIRNVDKPDEEKKTQILQCLHKSKKGGFGLPIFEESNGTQRSYSILSDVLPILKKGGLVAFDEIEDGLHPHVAKRIIALFENKETNPHNAQFLFSTHQHLLLNDRTKTQIFITEKNPDSFETEIYRLDEVEGVRNDENYFHKYMAGAYGGAPKIKWL